MNNISVQDSNSNSSELSYAEKLAILFKIPAGTVPMMGHWNNDTNCD